MLSQVRGALKGAVAWFVVVLLILAFAMFGVPEMREFTQNSAVSVGNESFSARYVQTEFNRAVQARRNESGGDYTREDAVAAGMADQVVSSIVTSSLLGQISKEMRLVMPRQIVSEYLQQNESFHNPATGRFDQAVLQGLLQRNNMTVKEFESRVAEDLRRNQLINALTASGPAPAPMVEAMLLRETEKRTISYLIVTDDMSGLAAEPTPDDLQTYYQQNPTVFTAPEYRNFDMLVLKSANFREGDATSEGELRKLYELNKPRLYDIPERRTLYQVTSFDTETEAQAAVAALRQGKPFENIAADQGFSLEDITFTNAQQRDILDPSVASAAFADNVEEGAILDPIQSLFGWTVVQIAGITPPETKTFEEVREELENSLLEQDTRRQLLNAIDAIEEERDTGAGLASAAETVGFEVTSLGPLDRYSFAPGGAIIANAPGEVIAEAFELEEGEESEALDLATRDGYFFVSVSEITPPAVIPFDDVRDEVEQRWRKQERGQRISAAVRSIRDAVSSGQSLEEAADPYSRAPIEMTIDRRFQNESITRDFNDQIFFADNGDLVSGPVDLGEAQIIADIRGITLNRNVSTSDEASMYKQYLGYQIDQELFEAFVSAIREDYDVKINRQQMDILFAEEQ